MGKWYVELTVYPETEQLLRELPDAANKPITEIPAIVTQYVTDYDDRTDETLVSILPSRRLDPEVKEVLRRTRKNIQRILQGSCELEKNPPPDETDVVISN